MKTITILVDGNEILCERVNHFCDQLRLLEALKKSIRPFRGTGKLSDAEFSDIKMDAIFDRFIHLYCTELEIRPTTLIQKGKDPFLSKMRSVAAIVWHDRSGESSTKMGKRNRFNRNHSTLWCGIKLVNDQKPIYKDIRDMLAIAERCYNEATANLQTDTKP